MESSERLSEASTVDQKRNGLGNVKQELQEGEAAVVAIVEPTGDSDDEV
jgi:hypothetical protein